MHDARRLGLDAAEQTVLDAESDPSIQAIPYCRLGERLLALAARRAGLQAFALRRPVEFHARDASKYDWVILADGAGSPLRHRLLPSPPQLLTPLKSAAAVFYPDFPDVRGLNARLLRLLRKYRCFWQTDGDERRQRRMVLLPNLRQKKSRRTLYLWLSPRTPVPEELYGQQTVRAFLRRPQPGAEDLQHDVALLDRQARRAAPGSRGLLSVYRMQEAAHPVVAGTQVQGAKVLLVGEAAWARDAPIDGESIPQALRQAIAAAEAVVAHNVSAYQHFMDGQLATRKSELARARRDRSRGPLLRHIEGEE